MISPPAPCPYPPSGTFPNPYPLWDFPLKGEEKGKWNVWERKRKIVFGGIKSVFLVCECRIVLSKTLLRFTCHHLRVQKSPSGDLGGCFHYP